MKEMMERLIDAALEAGKVIMQVRENGAGVSYKSDDSPVTEADRRAEEIIISHLNRHFPQIPLIAEESFAAGRRPSLETGCFFLVDPLDGTREFIGGHDDFTVNIALIRDGVPVAGVVSAPALDILWSGEGSSAEKFEISPSGRLGPGHKIHVRPASGHIKALISRSHCNESTRNFLKDNAIDDCVEAGSSLKFCLIAEGVADIYPRFTPTMMWDTAAGDAVLRAAGGITFNANGEVLTYHIGDTGQRSLRNPDFIARGSHNAGSTIPAIGTRWPGESHP